MNWAVVIWLVLLILFLIVEAVCAIHLVCLWFAVGALVALIAAIAGASTAIQIGLFLVVSCALLALLWPLVKKYLNPSHVATNIDSIIGSQGLVTESIDNVTAQGQVKIGAMYWTARSTSGESIAAGTKIKVDTIEGVKVFVTPVEEFVRV